MHLSDALQLGNQLLRRHNLYDWSFGFDRAKNRKGITYYGQKVITLSKYFVELNEPERVTKTILHEIAHALTPGHNHDAVWKAKAIEIGGDGLRTGTPSVSPSKLYKGECKCKDRHYSANRLSQRFRNGFCPICKHNVLWKNTRTNKWTIADRGANIQDFVNYANKI